jgi:hypothetical protein
VLSSATLRVKAKAGAGSLDVGALLGWTNDGKHLVAEKAVLDARTLKVVARAGTDPRSGVWPSPDGKWLARVRPVVESDPEVHIEKAKDGPAPSKYALHNRAWSPRSDMLLLEGKLYRTDGKVVRSRYAWQPACFCPDGKRFASLLEGTLRVIDTGTAREVLKMVVPTSDPTSPFKSSTVLWTPDGKTLLAGDIGLGLGVFAAATLGRRGTLYALGNGRILASAADGHYRGSPGVEADLVASVDTGKARLLLAPAEFARRFGFENDPKRALLLGPDEEP